MFHIWKLRFNLDNKKEDPHLRHHNLQGIVLCNALPTIEDEGDTIMLPHHQLFVVAVAGEGG